MSMIGVSVIGVTRYAAPASMASLAWLYDVGNGVKQDIEFATGQVRRRRIQRARDYFAHAVAQRCQRYPGHQSNPGRQHAIAIVQHLLPNLLHDHARAVAVLDDDVQEPSQIAGRG